jgi:hypothetical protein
MSRSLLVALRCSVLVCGDAPNGFYANERFGLWLCPHHHRVLGGVLVQAAERCSGCWQVYAASVLREVEYGAGTRGMICPGCNEREAWRA